MDPLAQLKDIHLPEAVSLWPPAIGWWILFTLSLAGLLVISFYVLRYVKKNRYRGIAVEELKRIQENYTQTNNKLVYIFNINRLLKKVAVNYYEKNSVSALSGQDWVSFLDSTADMQDFTQGAGQILASAPYSPPEQIEKTTVDTESLYRCTLQWIRKHK